MKHLKQIGLVIMLMLIMIPAVSLAEGLGNARLSFVDGDVQIKSEDSEEWFPVSVNMPLRGGDRIWVPGGSRAELQVAGGAKVRLDEMSSLEILNVERDSSQFYLTEGSAYIYFRGGRDRDLLQIDTPVSSIRAYDLTAFGVDVARNGDTDLSVYKGMVYAENGDGRTRVTSGSRLEIGEDYADLGSLGRADEWERWNTDRDRRFEERRYSSQYLPDELKIYAGDFDDNGKWINIGDAAYVWVPADQVSEAWSPYRNGRWSWIGNDYVWIGYEPWGWAPYHYGRWAHSSSVGWFWVPPVRGEVYWGPGYVGWVRTPTYVAWVPLAPRDTYYGYGNYGPHSVNLINVNINTIVIKNKYINVHVRNSFTAVHNDTFIRGKHVDFKLRDNPFTKEKIHIGRPDIKPERESRMTVIRNIPKFKEPPQKIRETKIREIMKTRPLVKEKEKSAFILNRPERQMKVKKLEVQRDRNKDRFEERAKERDKNIRGQDRQRPDEKKKEGAPAEKGGMEEKRVRPQDSLGERRTEPGRPAGVLPSDSPANKRPEGQTGQPDRRLVQPEQKDVKPEQPKIKQKDTEPVQNRQMKREEPQQKMQEKKADIDAKQKEKEKRKKVRDEKDAIKPAGEGSQQPPERGVPAFR